MCKRRYVVDTTRNSEVIELARRCDPNKLNNQTTTGSSDPYDIVLLQDTGLIAKKADANCMGPDYTVNHDPTPQTSGRGVAIGIHSKLNATLTNITRGSQVGHIAAVRIISGDLTFPTQDGNLYTVEITSFYVPCNKVYIYIYIYIYSGSAWFNTM
ncbi:hypothetical protein T492DRAFT_512447 [Pavlovales sp. CCMP2436]|nr:hypothetical protein T492DRAFT_512447 [Pavlovales sp. CCMP2436]